ncbi:MAG: YtzH-like family protein [Bacillaceae bacterium]|nr:YtzH-like family protein [Bacillaceae bacterium]
MNHLNQLTLIADILKNQQAEKTGTQDEFEQIQRLAQSLQQNSNVDSNIQHLLSNIEQYCTSGHCLENTDSLQSWITSIDSVIDRG